MAVYIIELGKPCPIEMNKAAPSLVYHWGVPHLLYVKVAPLSARRRAAACRVLAGRSHGAKEAVRDLPAVRPIRLGAYAVAIAA